MSAICENITNFYLFFSKSCRLKMKLWINGLHKSFVRGINQIFCDLILNRNQAGQAISNHIRFGQCYRRKDLWKAAIRNFNFKWTVFEKAVKDWCILWLIIISFRWIKGRIKILLYINMIELTKNYKNIVFTCYNVD